MDFIHGPEVVRKKLKRWSVLPCTVNDLGPNLPPIEINGGFTIDFTRIRIRPLVNNNKNTVWSTM